jgi:hypothetical protein
MVSGAEGLHVPCERFTSGLLAWRNLPKTTSKPVFKRFELDEASTWRENSSHSDWRMLEIPG